MNMKWRGDERLVVMRMDGVSQVIMATPAIRAIRNALPEAHITLITGNAAATLEPCFEGIDQVVPFPALWCDSRRELPFDPEREHAFIDELEDGKYDAAIVLTSQKHSSLPAAYACYMAGIPLRLGRSAENAGSLLTHRLKGFGQGHEVERCLEVVGAWGFHEDNPAPSLSTGEKAAEAGRQLLRNHGVDGQPYAVVQVGPAAGGREIPAAAYAKVLVDLVTRFNFLPVLTGLPQDRVEAEWIAGEAGTPSLVMVGETSLSELAAVIDGARVVVSADPTPTHIASAYGLPSLVLYQNEPPPEPWRPWGRSDCLKAGDERTGEALVQLVGANEGALQLAS
jgi:ADP-heptose:LPS heptosyltransferase